jgi:hypothetical protein
MAALLKLGEGALGANNARNTRTLALARSVARDLVECVVRLANFEQAWIIAVL